MVCEPGAPHRCPAEMAITDDRTKKAPEPRPEPDAPTEATAITEWSDVQSSPRSATMARVASADTEDPGSRQRPGVFAPPLGSLVDGRYQVRGELGSGGFAQCCASPTCSKAASSGR